MFRNAEGFTPLDIAFANNSSKSINLLIEIMCKYYDNPYFNYILDEKICELIKKHVTLNLYFESSLPMMILNSKNFPAFHSDNSEILKAAPY